MAGGRIKGITIEIGGDTTGLQKALKEVNREIQNTQSQLKDVERLLKLDPGNTELLTKKQNLLGQSVGETGDRLKTLKTAAEQANKELANGNISQAQYDALQREIVENELALKNLEKQAGGSSVALQKMTATGEKIKSVSSEIGDVGRALRPLSTTAAAIGVAGVKAAIDWESALTGVRKTVDMTDEEFDKLADGIEEMAQRTASSREEIAGVAEVAGQLGIANEDLLDFTETMVMLGDTTNLTAQEAATSLARFINITGDSQADAERLGSAIVDLGNNFATSESEIVTMATRLASAGTIAGLSSTDILALSTAMSSVGIRAEAGGTAMTQTLTALEETVVHWRNATGDELESATENLKTFADVAGMELEDFANTWETKPIEAVQSFIAGLGDLDESGDSMILKLEELGLTGIRQQNMLEALGLASDVLADSINTSSEAYENNTALAEEASKRYDTMESKLSQVKESLKTMATDIGEALMPILQELTEKLKDLVSWWKNLSDGAKDFIITAGGIIAVLSPVLTFLSNFGKVAGGIFTGGAKVAGWVKGLTGAGSAVAGVETAATSATAALGGLGTAGATAAAGAETAAAGVAATGTAAAGAATSIGGMLLAASPLVGVLAGIGIGAAQGIEHIKAFDAELSVQYQTVAEAEAALASLQEQYAKNHTDIENLVNSGADFSAEMQRESELTALIAEAQRQLTELRETEAGATEALTDKLDENTSALDENATAMNEATENIETAATESYATATEALTEVEDKTRQICETVNTEFSNLATTLPATLESVVQAIRTAWNQVQAIFGGGAETGAEGGTEGGGLTAMITNAFAGLNETVSASLAALELTITTAWASITESNTLNWTTMLTMFTTHMTMLQELVTSTVTMLTAFLSESWAMEIANTTASLETIQAAITTVCSSIVASITETMTLVISAINVGVQQITAVIQALVGSAYGWGADFVGQFAAGIMSRMSSVLAAVQSMAAQIRSYLHFSEPDVGPLSDFHTWMPDFMEGLAKGINDNRYLVENAIGRLTESMVITPKLATAGAGAGMESKHKHDHTGTITVKGVTDDNQLVGVVDIVIDQLRREIRM